MSVIDNNLDIPQDVFPYSYGEPFPVLANNGSTYGSTSIYGTIVGRDGLENQILRTLRVWMVPYVADVERQQGLPPKSTPIPPTPESFTGGVDFETWEQDLSPQIITVVNPYGEVERFDGGAYGSWFEVQVAAGVYAQSQDDARILAGIYGTALQALLTEQGDFGLRATTDGWRGYAERTRMIEAARVEWMNPDTRAQILTIVSVHTYLSGIADDFAGPAIPPVDPYALPEAWPEADKINIDLLRGDPDSSGVVEADQTTIDGTVVPPQTIYGQEVEIDLDN